MQVISQFVELCEFSILWSTSKTKVNKVSITLRPKPYVSKLLLMMITKFKQGSVYMFFQKIKSVKTIWGTTEHTGAIYLLWSSSISKHQISTPAKALKSLWGQIVNYGLCPLCTSSLHSHKSIRHTMHFKSKPHHPNMP